MMISPLKIIKKSDSWERFSANLSKLSRNDKGDCFEELTRFFLKTNPTYISKIKNIWNVNEDEVPFNVKQILNLPDADEGIDLIAETYDKKFWTIQCKYKSNTKKSLNRDDVSTFLDLTFNVCNESLIDLALICTPCEKYSYKFDKLYKRNAKFEKLYKLKEKKISFLYGTDWSKLDKEDFSKINNLINKKIINFKPIIKAQHQRTALKEIKDYFQDSKNNKGKLILPCGTGKSLIGYWASNDLKSKNTIVIVPSLALIKQTFNSWAKENIAINKRFDWIVICSDKSTIKTKRDDVTLQLSDLGIKVENQVERVSEWLKSSSSTKKVVFVTYDSSHIIAKASKKIKFKFDLGIFDEAHKTAGAKNNKFTHLLTNQNININKRIFMTATERFYSGNKKNIFSMDDKKIYGKIIHELSFKEALKLKRADGSPILVDYQIVTIHVTDKEIIDLIGSNRYLKPRKNINWEKDIEAHTLASAFALKKAFNDYNLNKLISFHSSLGRADLFREYLDKLSKYGKTTNSYIYGQLPTFKRQNLIDSFVNSKKSVLSNARCLTEGVDIPVCDGVLFADPKESKIDIVQACGRALRPHKGKNIGHIIVPILINVEDSKINKIKKSYQTIISTIDAIGSQDTRIVDYFDAITTGRKLKGGRPVKEIVSSAYEKDFDEIYKAVNLQIASRLQGFIKNKLNQKQILLWADDYHKQNNTWPNASSGKIDGTENETWAGISIALHRGLRGLTNQYTLADLLQEFRGVKNVQNLYDLDEATIINWAQHHNKTTGEYPNQNSGTVLANPMDTWNAINDALADGRRGLKKTTLVQLLEKKGLRASKSKIGRKDLSEKKIKKWIKDYYEKNNKYPIATSDEIIPNSSNTKWQDVANALIGGFRGLKGGITFSYFLKENFNVINNYTKDDLSIDFILFHADKYFEENKKWPKKNSGKIKDTDEKWSAIHSALQKGSRSLPKNNTLAGTLFKHRNVPFSGKHKDKNLSIAEVLEYCDEYFKDNNKWPNSKLRTTKTLIKGTNLMWSTLISSLNKGSNGLPKITLANLLARERGYINRYNNTHKHSLSINKIMTWAKEYKRINLKWPTAESGDVKGTENENWKAIDEALRNGRRGLDRNDSISKLIKRHEEYYREWNKSKKNR